PIADTIPKTILTGDDQERVQEDQGHNRARPTKQDPEGKERYPVDCQTYFEQPVWQTLNMFIGEFCCLIEFHWINCSINNESRESVDEQEKEAENERRRSSSFLLPDHLVQPSHLSKSHGPSTNPPLLAVHGPPDQLVDRPEPGVQNLTGLQKMVFCLPTMFDICGTTLMNKTDGSPKEYQKNVTIYYEVYSHYQYDLDRSKAGPSNRKEQAEGDRCYSGLSFECERCRKVLKVPGMVRNRESELKKLKIEHLNQHLARDLLGEDWKENRPKAASSSSTMKVWVWPKAVGDEARAQNCIGSVWRLERNCRCPYGANLYFGAYGRHGQDTLEDGWLAGSEYKEGFKGLEQVKDSTRITGQKSRGYRIKGAENSVVRIKNNKREALV
ncbi:hypothetical protein BY996DRAFT_6521160, partial [Phakopsora pachyrhizi]